MTDYDHGYSDGYQQARADMHDNVEPMIEVADRFAHRLALYLELVLSDADQPTDKWWNEATQLIGEYRSAMNAIHEKHCPTFMGEPVIPKPDVCIWKSVGGIATDRSSRMNFTKEEVQGILGAITGPIYGAPVFGEPVKAAISLLQSKLAECPHGVDDGACKECYNEAVKDDGEPVAAAWALGRGGKGG